MFGRFFGGSSDENHDATPLKRVQDPRENEQGPAGDAAARRTTREHFGFPSKDEHGHPVPMPAPAAQSESRATFDVLGQTLVATLTVPTVTGPEAADLAAELVDKVRSSSVPGGLRHIILDVQNVQYMDSACIGVLVELLGRLRSAGGRIALVNASSNVEYLFKLTRLDRVFPICRDVMKAIEVVEREQA